MDTGSRLEVLDIHSQFLDILKESNAGYYYINVKQEKTWVPILPRFTIITNIQNNIFKLSINILDEQKSSFS